jgi:hypothetical protein
MLKEVVKEVLTLVCGRGAMLKEVVKEVLTLVCTIA